jgi:hypothetical protein
VIDFPFFAFAALDNSGLNVTDSLKVIQPFV